MDGCIDVQELPSQNIVSIPDLADGVCVDYLHLKMEKVIFKQIVCYPLGKMGPTQATEQIQLVIFYMLVETFFSCTIVFSFTSYSQYFI